MRTTTLSFGTPFRGPTTKLGVERGQARPGLLGRTSMKNSAEESAAAVKFLSFVRHEQTRIRPTEFGKGSVPRLRDPTSFSPLAKFTQPTNQIFPRSYNYGCLSLPNSD